MKKILIAVVFVLMVGCDKADYSKNMQSSTVRAGTDLAITATLDEAPVANELEFLKLKQALMEGAVDVKKFLDSGSIGELPIDQIEAKIKEILAKKGWGSPLINQILDTIKNFLDSQHVDVSKIKPYAKYLMIEAMDQVIEAATKSKYEWRRPNGQTVKIKISGGDASIEVKTPMVNEPKVEPPAETPTPASTPTPAPAPAATPVPQPVEPKPVGLDFPDMQPVKIAAHTKLNVTREPCTRLPRQLIRGN